MPVAASEIESGQKDSLGAHTDFGSITLLFQDDCGGLEVEVPDEPGTFIPATPVEGALVMNIGDIMMRWTNGMSSTILSMHFYLLISWLCLC